MLFVRLARPDAGLGRLHQLVYDFLGYMGEGFLRRLAAFLAQDFIPGLPATPDSPLPADGGTWSRKVCDGAELTNEHRAAFAEFKRVLREAEKAADAA